MESADHVFKNIRQVASWLTANGYKISQSTLYTHVEQKKITPDKSGKYPISRVRSYAKKFLKVAELGMTAGEDQFAEMKAKAEVAAKMETTKLAKLKREILEGKYMLRSEFALELASRAGVLETGFKGWILRMASEIIGWVDGDSGKAPILVDRMLDELDRHLNSYASTTEYHVIFSTEDDGEEDEDL